MSVYATRADLASYSIPARVLADVPTVDQDKILEAASQKVDSYLGTRFKLPLTSWGKDLTEAVCSIAAFKVMTRRGYQPGVDDSDTFQKNSDDTFKWLKHIADGLATPVGLVESAVVASTEGTDQGDSFVVSPASGGIGLSGRAFNDGTMADVAIGTVGEARLRGF